MTTQAMPIFTPIQSPRRLGWRGRGVAALVAGACLAVLMAAAYLTPDPAGVGTTTRIGLRPCGFLQTTGLPCAACGMTTSFNHFVRGDLVASFWVQPMGFVLAIATGFCFWGGAYVAATGRPAHRLLQRLPGVKIVIGAVGFGIAAWGWKILLTFLDVSGSV